MITVNNRRYNIDAQACLRAYFIENIGWHDIHTSPHFTEEERSVLFGPDLNLRTQKVIRQSPEWVELVSEFARENGIDVQHAIRKAIFLPRGPQKKTQKAKSAEPQTPLENEVVQAACTDAAKAESEVKDVRKHVNNLAQMVLDAHKRIADVEKTVAEIQASPAYQLFVGKRCRVTTRPIPRAPTTGALAFSAPRKIMGTYSNHRCESIVETKITCGPGNHRASLPAGRPTDGGTRCKRQRSCQPLRGVESLARKHRRKRLPDSE